MISIYFDKNSTLWLLADKSRFDATRNMLLSVYESSALACFLVGEYRNEFSLSVISAKLAAVTKKTLHLWFENLSYVY